MRLDEYQIANALIDTRLVMTSRLGTTFRPHGSPDGLEVPCPFLGANRQPTLFSE
jgi:hypothetical protein